MQYFAIPGPTALPTSRATVCTREFGGKKQTIDWFGCVHFVHRAIHVPRHGWAGGQKWGRKGVAQLGGICTQKGTA